MRVRKTDLHHFKDWKEYRKKVLTKAVKIDGPFDVETSEGQFHCIDGYLAIDARGYPYAIATEEFDLIYEEVSAQKTKPVENSLPTHTKHQQRRKS